MDPSGRLGQPQGHTRQPAGDAMTAELVEVEPLTVLYAIRYGLGRLTYAHGDAITLALTHASALRQWADSLIPDIRTSEYDPTYPTMAGCRDWYCRQRHDRAVEALQADG